MRSNKDKKSLKNKIMERNVISKNTKIIGDIISEGDFRIDGTLEGTLNTKGKIIVGLEGSINGSVEAKDSDIEGKFSGKLSISNTLTIKETANISGEIIVGKLSVEPGASFNGTCSMKSSLKEIKSIHGKAEKTA